MNIQEALNVLGLSGKVTEIELKKAFKKMALKFHPDRNPVGAEMMKAVNCAYEFLKDNIERVEAHTEQPADTASAYNFGEKLEAVLMALMKMDGVIFEVIGNWVWVSGATMPHKDQIKALGCKWAPKKKVWFYRPDEHKSSFNRTEHDIDTIRGMYGTSGAMSGRGSARLAGNV
ncbi:MAG: J domain-containing protein [Aeromonas sp.]